MKKSIITFFFACLQVLLFAQQEHHLIGYWHNWNHAEAPYISLNQIDDRYDIIILAFAIPSYTGNMVMEFTPEEGNISQFISQIQALQNQGKKVLISIGGATGQLNVADEVKKNTFILSMNTLIDQYGFDGMDIDIESGDCILTTGGSIAAPTSQGQLNMIDAVRQIMAHYRQTHHKKMMLTAAPETAYVQGGMSGFSSIWGGYLPLLDALRDSLDILHVQLYNSGTMFGIDGNIYTVGTEDFIVSQTEALLQGFNTAGGYFAPFPAHKIAVGLPACASAAGSGYVNPTGVYAAIKYLLGEDSQPGSYQLAHSEGYPNLLGMMTWSINWDAAANCDENYSFTENYENIFGDVPIILSDKNDILSFDIPNQLISTIFPDTKFIRVIMAEGSDLSSLTPSISISKAATINPQNGINLDFTDTVVYTVTAENGDMQDWKVKVMRIEGVEQLITTQIYIYPNPSQGFFTIQCTSHQTIEKIRIFDTKGTLLKEIADSEQSSCQLQIENKGMYFVEIKTGKENYFRKVIIQ